VIEADIPLHRGRLDGAGRSGRGIDGRAHRERAVGARAFTDSARGEEVNCRKTRDPRAGVGYWPRTAGLAPLLAEFTAARIVVLSPDGLLPTMKKHRLRWWWPATRIARLHRTVGVPRLNTDPYLLPRGRISLLTCRRGAKALAGHRRIRRAETTEESPERVAVGVAGLSWPLPRNPGAL